MGILDFVFDEDRHNPDFFHFVQLKDQVNQVFYDKLTFIYLEMPKFRKTESELETDFDKWMYVFKNMHLLERIPAKFQTKIFQKLFGEAELANLKPVDMIAYEESLKVYRDLKAVTDTAYDDGYKEAEDVYMAKLMEERKLKDEERKLKEEERKLKEEAIQKQNDAIQKQNDAIQKQNDAIQKQNDAIQLMILSGIDKETIAHHLNISVEYIDNLSNKTK